MWFHMRPACLAFFFLLNSLSVAFADECSVLFAAQILEARISSMRETVPRGDPGTQLQPLLNQLFTGAAALDASEYRDPDLAFAVRSFKNSLADISNADFDRPVAVAHLLVGPRHRVLLRRMIILANDVCDNKSAGQTEFGRDSGRKINWGLIGLEGIVFLAAASASIFFSVRIYNKRKAQKQRHYCRIPTQISLEQGSFVSNMFDISALGAKFEKFETGDLDGPVKLIIGDTRLTATLQWQNAHVFGVRFQQALPLKKVLSIIQADYEPVASDQA